LPPLESVSKNKGRVRSILNVCLSTQRPDVQRTIQFLHVLHVSLRIFFTHPTFSLAVLDALLSKSPKPNCQRSKPPFFQGRQMRLPDSFSLSPGLQHRNPEQPLPFKEEAAFSARHRQRRTKLEAQA
jgi:hypothetical protein